MSKVIKKQIGVVGVDSGQILVCDPCYIDSHWIHPKSEDYFDFEKKEFKGQFSYAGCANSTMNKQLGGQLNYNNGLKGAGVTCSSGLGDGVYPVYAYYRDNRIIKIEVEF